MSIEPRQPPGRRLAEVGRLAASGRVADVGADHGLLARWLADRPGVEHVYATERLERGRRGLERALGDLVAAGRVSVHGGDGLAPLADVEVDTVVLAGMGSRTIVRILSAARRPLRLVAQPQSEAWRLRRWLCENGWGLLDERYVEEGGRSYLLLCAEPARRFAASDARLPLEDLYHAGPLLVARRDAHALALWRRRSRELETIVGGARAAGELAAAAEEELRRSRRIMEAMGP